jgi:hypothetical protein
MTDDYRRGYEAGREQSAKVVEEWAKAFRNQDLRKTVAARIRALTAPSQPAPAVGGEPNERCRSELVSGGLCQRKRGHTGHCMLVEPGSGDGSGANVCLCQAPEWCGNEDWRGRTRWCSRDCAKGRAP